MLPSKFVLAMIESSFLVSWDLKIASSIYLSIPSTCVQKYVTLQTQVSFCILPPRHLFDPDAFLFASLSCMPA